MFCASCGNSLPDNAAFCPVCGAKITPAKGAPIRNTPKDSAFAEPAGTRMRTMKCTACGSISLKKIRTGEYICEYCGTRLLVDEPDAPKDAAGQDVSVEVLLAQAESCAEKGDLQNELQTLLKAAELAPENNDVLLRLGRSYWKLGLIDKAMEYYRKAGELYPDDPIVYVNMGSAYLKMGLYEEAKPQYEKAIAMIEKDPASACLSDTAVAYGNYALCIGKLGDKRSARKYLSAAKKKGYSPSSIDSICRQLNLNKLFI